MSPSSPWTEKEDECLAKAWKQHAKSLGKNVVLGGFTNWDEILNRFRKELGIDSPPRDDSKIKSRWHHVILPEVKRFCDILAELRKQKQDPTSSKSELLEMAARRYHDIPIHDSNPSKKFPYMKAYLVLEDCPKFAELPNDPPRAFQLAKPGLQDRNPIIIDLTSDGDEKSMETTKERSTRNAAAIGKRGETHPRPVSSESEQDAMMDDDDPSFVPWPILSKSMRRPPTNDVPEKSITNETDATTSNPKRGSAKRAWTSPVESPSSSPLRSPPKRARRSLLRSPSNSPLRDDLRTPPGSPPKSPTQILEQRLLKSPRESPPRTPPKSPPKSSTVNPPKSPPKSSAVNPPKCPPLNQTKGPQNITISQNSAEVENSWPHKALSKFEDCARVLSKNLAEHTAVLHRLAQGREEAAKRKRCETLFVVAGSNQFSLSNEDQGRVERIRREYVYSLLGQVENDYGIASSTTAIQNGERREGNVVANGETSGS